MPSSYCTASWRIAPTSGACGPTKKSLAPSLREATVDELRDLEDLMSGQGFVLVQLTSFDIEGIVVSRVPGRAPCGHAILPGRW